MVFMVIPKLVLIISLLASILGVGLHFYRKDVAEQQARQAFQKERDRYRDKGAFGCVSCSLPRRDKDRP
jgi:hypothetical protein